MNENEHPINNGGNPSINSVGPADKIENIPKSAQDNTFTSNLLPDAFGTDNTTYTQGFISNPSGPAGHMPGKKEN